MKQPLLHISFTAICEDTEENVKSVIINQSAPWNDKYNLKHMRDLLWTKAFHQVAQFCEENNYSLLSIYMQQ